MHLMPTLARNAAQLRLQRTHLANQKHRVLFRIRPTYISAGLEGVAAIPYTDFMYGLCESVCAGGHSGPPLREELSLATLGAHQPRCDDQTHTHRQDPKLTRDDIYFREASHHQRDHHRNRNAGHYPRDNRGNHAISLPESPLPGIFSL